MLNRSCPGAGTSSRLYPTGLPRCISETVHRGLENMVSTRSLGKVLSVHPRSSRRFVTWHLPCANSVSPSDPFASQTIILEADPYTAGRSAPAPTGSSLTAAQSIRQADTLTDFQARRLQRRLDDLEVSSSFISKVEEGRGLRAMQGWM